MIAFNHLKLLLATPPATASVTLHETLCGAEFGGVWVIGPAGDLDYEANQHTLLTDPLHRDWALAIVVRNPFDRLVSLWHKLVREQEAKCEPPWSFEEYVRSLRAPPNDLHWMYRWTISDWIGQRPVQRILRVESLARDVRSLLEQPVKLPRLNASMRQQPLHRYYERSETLAAARAWAEPDCQRYGYSYDLEGSKTC